MVKPTAMNTQILIAAYSLVSLLVIAHLPRKSWWALPKTPRPGFGSPALPAEAEFLALYEPHEKQAEFHRVQPRVPDR